MRQVRVPTNLNTFFLRGRLFSFFQQVPLWQTTLVWVALGVALGSARLDVILPSGGFIWILLFFSALHLVAALLFLVYSKARSDREYRQLYSGVTHEYWGEYCTLRKGPRSGLRGYH